MVEPVLEMRIQRDRLVVARDREEVALLERHERVDVRAQRRLEVRLDAQDVLRASATPCTWSRRRWPSSRTPPRSPGAVNWRQAAVALLLEPQRGVRAGKLALQQHDFVVPGHRHEVDVAQAPVVGLLADARTARSCPAPAARATRRTPRSRRGRRQWRGAGRGRRPDVFAARSSRLLTWPCIVPVPVIQRSRALPVRFSRACCSNGGTVRSCVVELRLVVAAQVETRTATVRPGRGAPVPRVRACRSARSRRTGRRPGRGPTAAARGGRSPCRSSARGPARSRCAVHASSRTGRSPRAAAGGASVPRAGARRSPPCNPARRRATWDARASATPARARRGRRTCPRSGRGVVIIRSPPNSRPAHAPVRVSEAHRRGSFPPVEAVVRVHGAGR